MCVVVFYLKYIINNFRKKTDSEWDVGNILMIVDISFAFVDVNISFFMSTLFEANKKISKVHFRHYFRNINYF